MRALVVGLGSIGRRHARNWAALGLGPLSVCRRITSETREALGVEAREFSDLDAALNEQPDAVLVTNPTSLHVETACKALRAGAHVFLEKPLGHSMDGVVEMLGQARDRKRQLMVGYNLRFHPGLHRIKELLTERAVGRVVSARVEAGEYLPDWHPWEDYRHAYSARRDLGGGPVLTFSHELDAACWLLGAPSRVIGMATQASSLEIDTEDTAEIVLQFADGRLASVHVDFVRRPPRRSLEVVGENGVLRWEYDEGRVLHYSPPTRQWRVEEGDPRFERNDMFLDELRHFVGCVRGEIERPLIDGEQGAAVLAIALAGLRSSATGGAVDLRTQGEPITTWLSSLGR
ncbi:MAG: Gfo/Idh/MocA family oxidoreductase [Chloroflexota bacterium]|nr:Gfo/Idh/MocA family oxidoreductase [Chloroflexota bacterium]